MLPFGALRLIITFFMYVWLIFNVTSMREMIAPVRVEVVRLEEAPDRRLSGMLVMVELVINIGI